MRRIFSTFYLFIIIVLAVLYFISEPVGEWAYNTYFKKELSTYLTDLSKGEYFLLEKQFVNADESEWPEILKTLQPHFGYALELKNIDKLNLPAQQIESLYAYKTVENFIEGYTYRRLGSSNMALALGPLPDFEDKVDTSKLELWIWIMLLLFVALLSLLWGFPFWRNLKAVMTSADSFGEGDLAARTRLPRRAALYPLSVTFNSMADRIQQLIDSHKMLLNAVSHELRTPISRIRFELEMMEDCDNETKDRYLEEMNRDIGELEALVDELLSYIKFDRERPVLLGEEIPWAEWIGNVIDKLSYQAGDIRIHAETSEESLSLYGDARFLTRLVENLVSNGIRYARSEVKISLELKKGVYRLKVEDDGPGVPESDRKRIFNPFIRLDQSRSRKSGGHGLGLAIVKQIMQWHNGDATASKSKLGGACITCKWPAADKPD